MSETEPEAQVASLADLDTPIGEMRRRWEG